MNTGSMMLPENSSAGKNKGQPKTAAPVLFLYYFESEATFL